MEVKLRAIEPEDLDFLYDLENDVENWSVGIEYAPISRRDLENYLYTYDRDPLRSGNLRMAICTVDSSTPIGLVDLYDIDAKNLNAMVGISIVPTQRHKGYARLALEKICKYSTSILGLSMLGAIVGEDNVGSRRLFESTGFVQTGIYPKWLIHNGIHKDMLLFCRSLQTE